MQLALGVLKACFILFVSCEFCEWLFGENCMAGLIVSFGVDVLIFIQDVFIGGNCFDVFNVILIGSFLSVG